MSDKITYKLSPSQFSSATLDLLIDIHALLQTQMQFVALDEARERDVTTEETMKEVNELYHRFRKEKVLSVVAEHGEPDVDLSSIDPISP